MENTDCLCSIPTKYLAYYPLILFLYCWPDTDSGNSLTYYLNQQVVLNGLVKTN